MARRLASIEGDPVSEDFYNALLTYSRKLTKKSFEELRRAYKSETGGDLCEDVAEAQSELFKDIRNLTQGEKGTKLRTMLYKGIDYTHYLKYCPVKGRRN